MPEARRALGVAGLAALAFLGSAVSALGQPPASRRESRAPIEIVSDSLTVRQNERIAVFSGNVDATQGDRSLRADELKVFYAQEQGGDGQGIRRIEATGRVVVAEPGQTAQGDRGVYDPVAERIQLDGNVVLTRGDDIVRGGQLEMDLTTGVAVVKAARPGGAPGERVRALFVPDQGRSGPEPGTTRSRPPKDAPAR